MTSLTRRGLIVAAAGALATAAVGVTAGVEYVWHLGAGRRVQAQFSGMRVTGIVRYERHWKILLAGDDGVTGAFDTDDRAVLAAMHKTMYARRTFTLELGGAD